MGRKVGLEEKLFQGVIIFSMITTERRISSLSATRFPLKGATVCHTLFAHATVVYSGTSQFLRVRQVEYEGTRHRDKVSEQLI